MSYNEIYANSDTGVTYKKYENIIGTGGKAVRNVAGTWENIPCALVKFPSTRTPSEKGYYDDELLQIAVPYDYAYDVLGGVREDDEVEYGGKKYRVHSYIDLTHDPLWGVIIIDCRRVRNAA